jgi:hypothetical protein
LSRHSSAAVAAIATIRFYQLAMEFVDEEQGFLPNVIRIPPPNIKELREGLTLRQGAGNFMQRLSPALNPP